ncbi:TM2 domain-containing protein 1 [Callorhinchus milii]|uniref:TM2 domain-containing protein 1 n=1 Tax=Callorhinchus milii TaxID=7868 RepID=UPI001C3F7FA2|nr:TM2 domain-containing protein 1 [Callorhinchus milii]XP_042191672.1 TM2 domain-containing protein 1 [Callorhinchus milii]
MALPGQRGLLPPLAAAVPLLLLLTGGAQAARAEGVQRCDQLLMGQYKCDSPDISETTQEPENCTNYTAYVACTPAPNITCKNYNGVVSTFSGKEVGFYKPISCRNVTNYSYKVAVALSLFLGWLGADRFYLGYPALGLLKFCTVGFCGIGSLIDFILISVQIVGPADGSSYIIDYYGARLIRLTINNDTYRKTQMDL